MTGVNDILKKIIFEEPLTEEERFKILRSKRIEPKVVEYLMEKLNNLYIEVLDKYKGSLFELMKNEKLEGWCWQTTESAIVFLNDDDYIDRGNLKFDERTKGEVVVHGPEDINTPLYRNGAGYKTEIENEKIKKLTVHYYYCDC